MRTELDVDDLVKRLKSMRGSDEQACDEAAAALLTLRAEWDVLREALQNVRTTLFALRAERDALREAGRCAELLWQWWDMMRDGPDDSDVALAEGWFAEAIVLAREMKRAALPPAPAADDNGGA